MNQLSSYHQSTSKQQDKYLFDQLESDKAPRFFLRRTPEEASEPRTQNYKYSEVLGLENIPNYAANSALDNLHAFENTFGVLQKVGGKCRRDLEIVTNSLRKEE